MLTAREPRQVSLTRGSCAPHHVGPPAPPGGAVNLSESVLVLEFEFRLPVVAIVHRFVVIDCVIDCVVPAKR